MPKGDVSVDILSSIVIKSSKILIHVIMAKRKETKNDNIAKGFEDF